MKADGVGPCHLAPHLMHLWRHLVCPVNGMGDLPVLGQQGNEVVPPPVLGWRIVPIPTIGHKENDFRGLVVHLWILVDAHLIAAVHNCPDRIPLLREALCLLEAGTLMSLKQG